MKSFGKMLAMALVCALLTAFAGCGLPIGGAAPAGETGGLTALFLDVGQADSTLLTLPDGRHMLIDGGNNNDGAKICAYLDEAGVDTIDFLVATHPHEGHIGGLDDVVEAFDIGKIYAPRLADASLPTTRTYEDFLLAVQDKGYKLTAAGAGDVLLDEGGLKAEVLSPAAEKYKELNDYSVVLRISYGQTNWLFTGDAEALCEKEMLENGFDVSADLLKVGHHGSRSSSSLEFINDVHPAYAVISCGAGNSYGHPHAETLQTLEGAGTQVFRTDQDGSVRAVSDGKTTQVTADKSIRCDGGR